VSVELERHHIDLGPEGVARVLRAFEDERRLAEMDRRNLAALAALDENGAAPVRVEVPAFAGDVHDLDRLAKVAAILAPG
jgi:hypothetical protein